MAIDSELMQALNRFGSGDESSFNIIYEKTYSYVYSRTRMIMKNEQDAMDLLQEVYIVAFKSMDKLENANNLFAWLGGIAYNQGMKIFNKKKDVLLDETGEGLFDIQESADTSFQPGVELELKETADIIKEVIEELPELQRAAITAYYYDEMSVTQIAELMETSTGTIKSRLNYARKRIQESVEEKEKQMGIRLHSTSVPALILALQAASSGYSITGTTAGMGYKSICGSLGIEKTMVEGTKKVVDTASSIDANISVASATGVGGTTVAGTSVAIKVLAGVCVALALVIGGGAIYLEKTKQDKVTTTEAVVQETDITEEPTTEEMINVYEVLAGSFCFSSGAGGWSTDMDVNTDGSFSGNHHSVDMGEPTDDYPNGKIYTCDFKGQLAEAQKISEFVYSADMEELQTGEIKDPYVENGYLTVMDEDPYGLRVADKVMIYLAGMPIEDLPNGVVSWMWEEEMQQGVLPYHIIYSEKDAAVFKGEKKTTESITDDSDPNAELLAQYRPVLDEYVEFQKNCASKEPLDPFEYIRNNCRYVGINTGQGWSADCSEGEEFLSSPIQGELYYALYDFGQDGTQELIMGSKDQDWDNYYIHGIYGFGDGNLMHVTESLMVFATGMGIRIKVLEGGYFLTYEVAIPEAYENGWKSPMYGVSVFNNVQLEKIENPLSAGYIKRIDNFNTEEEVYNTYKEATLEWRKVDLDNIVTPSLEKQVASVDVEIIPIDDLCAKSVITAKDKDNQVVWTYETEQSRYQADYNFAKHWETNSRVFVLMDQFLLVLERETGNVFTYEQHLSVGKSYEGDDFFLVWCTDESAVNVLKMSHEGEILWKTNITNYMQTEYPSTTHVENGEIREMMNIDKNTQEPWFTLDLETGNILYYAFDNASGS